MKITPPHDSVMITTTTHKSVMSDDTMARFVHVGLALRWTKGAAMPDDVIDGVDVPTFANGPPWVVRLSSIISFKQEPECKAHEGLVQHKGLSRLSPRDWGLKLQQTREPPPQSS